MTSKIISSFAFCFLLGMFIFAFTLLTCLKGSFSVGLVIIVTSLLANLIFLLLGFLISYYMSGDVNKFMDDYEENREITNVVAFNIQKAASYLPYWIALTLALLLFSSSAVVSYYANKNLNISSWEVSTLLLAGVISGLVAFLFCVSVLEKVFYTVREKADQKNTLPSSEHPGPSMFSKLFIEFTAFTLSLMLLVGLYMHNTIMYGFKKLIATTPSFESQISILRGDLIGFLGVGILFAYLIASSYASISIIPIKKLENYLKSITGGDLSQRLLAGSSDELFSISRSISYLVNSLKLMIFKAKEMGFDINAAVQDIRASEEQQAQGAIATAKTLGNAISVLQDLTASAAQVHKNAEGVAQAARATLSASKYGLEAIDVINSEMGKIKIKVSEIVRGISVLEDRSNQINSIASVIDDITEQTNLLAVNASIEAARAGEAGKGFAVVATEIRKLAERATESTKEIKVLISEIQSDTYATVAATRESTISVERGIDNIKETSKAIEKINQMIVHTSTAAQEILNAASQQKGATDEIVSSIQGLSAVSHNFEDSARRLVESTHKLNQLVEELKASTVGFHMEGS